MQPVSVTEGRWYDSFGSIEPWEIHEQKKTMVKMIIALKGTQPCGNKENFLKVQKTPHQDMAGTAHCLPPQVIEPYRGDSINDEKILKR